MDRRFGPLFCALASRVAPSLTEKIAFRAPQSASPARPLPEPEARARECADIANGCLP